MRAGEAGRAGKLLLGSPDSPLQGQGGCGAVRETGVWAPDLGAGHGRRSTFSPARASAAWPVPRGRAGSAVPDSAPELRDR